MASFVASLARLAFNREPRKHKDEERATEVPSTFGSHLGPSRSQIGTAAGHVLSDDLTSFRLILGITNAAELGFREPGTGRPADNIGLYSRVVHSEQKAKDSYKVFSVVINACYFLQIIVAAALTALGAANANNKAITAFGAFNTIIAGFLTYLKGSGLPGRLKFYGNEWKKIREYIEQRERDFSHEKCTLDVHEVVETVRQMYANTKRDIEMNSPDSYNSVSNVRTMGGDGIDTSKFDDVARKLRKLDETIVNLGGRIEKTTRDVHDDVHSAYDDGKVVMADIRSIGKAVKLGVE